jgi:DNA-binding SARP family transcriptional activator
VEAVVEFRILGPLEVRYDEREPIALGGPTQRAVLGALILRPNEVVSSDRLIDQVWNERPPADALHTLQVFVSRLRAKLGPAGVRLATRPPGYRLEIRVDELDADRCERLYRDGRAALASGDAERATALLRQADAMWRGPPLAEFTYQPFAQATIARLEELRVSCTEERIEADLALGRHAHVVAELEELVREQPYRERPCGQLMVALYRTGRQADALDAFRRARQTLVEDLAVEPGAPLRELEQAILRQDLSLLAPSRPPPPSPPEPIETGPVERGQIRSPQDAPAAVVDDATLAAGEEPRRRTVVVLAAILAGRARGGVLDIESEELVISAGHKRALEIVARHKGDLVSSPLKHEVFGLFGRHEHSALRALAAAEELRLCGADGAGPAELVVRIGVDSGVIVAPASSSLVVGARDLAQRAEPGEVLLSDATRRLARRIIRVAPGPAPSTWRLRSLVLGGWAVERDAPIVGRARELGRAEAAFEEAVITTSAQLLTVIGDAGVGKSRVARELAERVADRAILLQGRCLSYGEGIAYWPLREALSQIGVESRDAIRELLGDVQDAEHVADIVAAAVGLDPPGHGGEQVRWAFRRLLEALASRRPVLLVIDDAHWAEPPLLELLEYLIDWLPGHPVLVLCLGRPELRGRPQLVGGHVRVSSLPLRPLPHDDAMRLLEEKLGEHPLGGSERTRILDRAEGNPLFVEQLLAMHKEDAWDEDDDEGEIPATIQALLAARLDRLGPGERAYIERAAVIGREFWTDAVVELLPPEARATAQQHKDALVKRGLISPERSTLQGEELLRFFHILVRDVAYRSTRKARRGELHERFAGWLERRGESYDEFVGYHLEQAFKYRRQLGSLGGDERALGVRAGERLASAGRRSLSRGEVGAAAKLLRRSADLFDAGGEQRADVLLDLGYALSESGDFPGAEQTLETALELARAAGEEALTARLRIELSRRRALVDPSARVEHKRKVANDAIRVFERVGDDSGLARAWMHIAGAYWTLSRCADMEEALERARVFAERAGDARLRSRILGDLARATVIGPRPVGEAIDRCTGCLEPAQDDITLTAIVRTMLAVLEAMRGEFGRARDYWQQARGALEDAGLNVMLASLQMYCAFIELMAGSPGLAEGELEDACFLLAQIGERHRRPTTCALLGRVLYAQGRYKEAAAKCELTRDEAAKDDVVSQVLWRGTLARVLVRTGARESARRHADSAMALVERTDFLLLHGDALVDRAAVLIAQNRPREAAADLTAAIQLYERKGASASAQVARGALGALGVGRAVNRA